MDKDQIDDMIKFAEKEPKLEESDFDKRHDDKPRFFNFQKKTLFIGGVVVLVIIIIIAFLSSGGSDPSTANFNALMMRVDRIEARLAGMEGIEERMTAALQAQKNTLSEGVTAAVGTGGTMVQQFDLLARKVELLQQKMDSVIKEPQANRSGTAQRVQPKKAQYHVVARGETLYRIAVKYGLTVDKLRDLNKMTPPQSIYPGQKLLVSAAKDT
jgi:LysM repeat protein